MILLIIFLSVLIIYFVFFTAQFYNIVFKGYAPFVSTPSKTVRAIVGEIGAFDGSVIYELGCGRALFLSQAEKVFPKAKLVGIENSFCLRLLGCLKMKLRQSRISIIKKDFFLENLSAAGLIYCYLNNATMDRLGEKIRRECCPGTIIISRCFPISDFKAEKIITINKQKVYFYIVGSG